MRNSLYWDDFSRRIDETVVCIRNNTPIPVRRVAIFITQRCNLNCTYCKQPKSPLTMSPQHFDSIINSYSDDTIFHITGGEPSIIPWLYPYLNKYGGTKKFHLNTNAVLPPPSRSIARLKVSLDSCDRDYWNNLVGVPTFDKVVRNIKNACKETVTSITYTTTAENYKQIPNFIKFASKEFPGLYAIFFSVYKGTNPRFVFTKEIIDDFFNNVKPIMITLLDPESRALFEETITEKMRVIQGIRFPENDVTTPCYISLSERVCTPEGNMSGCSHLIRDGVKNNPGTKFPQCSYGCNRRLVAFNEEVEKRLNS